MNKTTTTFIIKARAKAKIIYIEKNQPHKVSEVICVSCRYRWIAVRPIETQLKDLQCRCGIIGAVIETGERMDINHTGEPHRYGG